MEIKGKGKPIFCGRDGKWKDELEKWPPTDDEIVAFALGDVKYDVPRYLNSRKGNEILKLETRYKKKRDKGTGLKAIVRSSTKPNNLEKL
jgi:hypothetical protein